MDSAGDTVSLVSLYATLSKPITRHVVYHTPTSSIALMDGLPFYYLAPKPISRALPWINRYLRIKLPVSMPFLSRVIAQKQTDTILNIPAETVTDSREASALTTSSPRSPQLACFQGGQLQLRINSITPTPLWDIRLPSSAVSLPPRQLAEGLL
ncbi:hypothetical protein J6590_075659 [Homalodisca vitripennis]|nr:hypothetical protein J6590_075659 [Homalodisca vitripennis]